MFCTNCGTRIDSNAAFCKECGVSVNKTLGTLPVSVVKDKGSMAGRLNPLARVGVVLFVAWVVGAVIFSEPVKKCDEPLEYALGSIDPLFGVQKNELLYILENAEYIWEEPANRNLFEYNPASSFKINFVYDERQQAIDTLNEATELSEEYDSLEEEYDYLVSQYNSRLINYNSQVDYWNSVGGAPDNVYYRLQAEKRSLTILGNRIDNMAYELDQKAADINTDIASFDAVFGEEEDIAYYYGDRIDVYAFYDRDSLELTLAHELGHYLGIDHTEGTLSLMYPLDLGQYEEDFELTSEDITALRGVCGF